MEERWKPVPYEEYSDSYEVSDQGRVRKRNGEIVASSTIGGGILRVSFYNPETKAVKTCRLARLVLDAFRPGSGHVHYQDGNPSNCTLDNLSHTAQPVVENSGPTESLTVQEVAAQTFAAVGPLITDALGRFKDAIASEPRLQHLIVQTPHLIASVAA